MYHAILLPLLCYVVHTEHLPRVLFALKNFILYTKTMIANALTCMYGRTALLERFLAN